MENDHQMLSLASNLSEPLEIDESRSNGFATRERYALPNIHIEDTELDFQTERYDFLMVQIIQQNFLIL